MLLCQDLVHSRLVSAVLEARSAIAGDYECRGDDADSLRLVLARRIEPFVGTIDGLPDVGVELFREG